MHLTLIDIAVVVVYATFVLAVSQVMRRDKRDRPDELDDYEPSRRALPWWAIGTSLIAANISAEQIIGMSGSAYAFGLAIASYEWLAAFALVFVGKYFLPIFLKNRISTMPEFLKRRYGTRTQVVMAIFFLGIYTFVSLTSIMWLGATAVHAVTGLTLQTSLILLALFAGNYALYVGLKAAAFTDVVQVCMLVLGGLVIAYIALVKVSALDGGGIGVSGLMHGFEVLRARLPSHFHMILSSANPYYKYMPGVAVLFGGMWVVHFAYWGFNQYIIQRALTAEDLGEVRKGVMLAAYLKLLVPILVVLPGIAAVLLVKDISRPDEAYPALMTLLPSGVQGFVFVALVAAIVASMGSTLSSIATIFTVDVFKVIQKSASRRLMIIVGRFAAIVALLCAMIAAQPLLRGVDQAFQYIQNYNGFFTPGITVIFLLGMFWPRATEAGALVAAIASALLSVFFAVFLPQMPFLNRMGIVFLICLALAALVSLFQKQQPAQSTIDVRVDYRTSSAYNIASLLIVGVLVVLYWAWW